MEKRKKEKAALDICGCYFCSSHPLFYSYAIRKGFAEMKFVDVLNLNHVTFLSPARDFSEVSIYFMSRWKPNCLSKRSRREQDCHETGANPR